jgi:chromosome partitioning protein
MLRIEGILLTMVDNRTNNSKEIIRLLHKNIGGNINIFKTSIPFSVKASESTGMHKSIYRHSPRCKVADAYRRLTEEVLEI